MVTAAINLESREHVELWIEEHQVGRRNLSDDQKAMLWDSIRERRSALEKKLRAQKGREVGGKATEEQKQDRLSDNVSDKRSGTTQQEKEV